MDSPEEEGSVKKKNPILRVLCVLGILGAATCGTTASEQKGVQYGQGMATRNAADATATATSEQAKKVGEQVDQALGQTTKPFAER